MWWCGGRWVPFKMAVKRENKNLLISCIFSMNMNIITLYKVTALLSFYSDLFFFIAFFFFTTWHVFICLLVSSHHNRSFIRARTLFCLLLYFHYLEQWLASSGLTRNICYMDDGWSHKPRSDLWKVSELLEIRDCILTWLPNRVPRLDT